MATCTEYRPLPGSAGEDLELLRLNQELVLGALAEEALKKGPSNFNKGVVLVVKRFFGDRGDVAAGPAFVERAVQRIKFLESTLHLEFAFGVLACDGVLDDLPD